MINNPTSSFYAIVCRKNLEDKSRSQDFEDAGNLSESVSSGEWVTCDRDQESHHKKRILVGVVYFFANHSLWKTPIVNFIHDKCTLENSADWRIATAGDGWVLGVDADGSPTLFLNVMEGTKVLPEKMGANSKSKPTPVKLFGFTIMPQRNDRVRTLIPYFTSKVCTSTAQRATKFQNLWPRGNRNKETGNTKKVVRKPDAKETILVPTDPEDYIEKDTLTNISIRLCGVSFITPLSVSDEFAFVRNTIPKSDALPVTKSNLPPCQTTDDTCLRISDCVQTAVLYSCNSQHLGKSDNVSKVTNVKGGNLYGVNPTCDTNERTTNFSSDSLKTITNRINEREQVINLTSSNEGVFAQSFGQLCNVVNSNAGCMVSSSISNNELPRSKHIPRTSSEDILSQPSVTEMPACAPNNNIFKPPSMANNKFNELLLSEPVNESFICGTSVRDESKAFNRDKKLASNLSIMNDGGSVTTMPLTKSVDDLHLSNNPWHDEEFFCEQRNILTKSLLPRPYSQTKFPLDIICSGKIGEIKKRNSFISSLQCKPSAKRFSTGNCVFVQKLDAIYPVNRSYSAGKIELMNQIPAKTLPIGCRLDHFRKERSSSSDHFCNGESCTKYGQFDDLSRSKKDNQSLVPKTIIKSSEKIIVSSTETPRSPPQTENVPFSINVLPIDNRNLDEMLAKNENKEIPLCKENTSTQSSVLNRVVNSKQEKSLVIFNFRNNSLENYLQTCHKCGPGSDNTLDLSTSPSCRGQDIILNEKLLDHNVLSCDIVNKPLHASCSIRNHSKVENFNLEAPKSDVCSEICPGSTIANGDSTHSSILSQCCINVRQPCINHIPETVSETNHEIVPLAIDDASFYIDKLNGERQPNTVFIEETTNHSECHAAHNGYQYYEQTGITIDKDQDMPPKITTVAKSTTMQSDVNINNAVLNGSMSKIPYFDCELPLVTKEEFDIKWRTLIENIMLEVFNWPQLSALVLKRRNRLGWNSIHVSTNSFNNNSFTSERTDEQISSLDLTNEQASGDRNQSNPNEDIFNFSALGANLGSWFEEKFSSAEQLNAQSETYIDASCIDNLSLRDEDSFKNDQRWDFEAPVYLDGEQTTFVQETNSGIQLLEPEFNPNSEEFYSNNEEFYSNNEEFYSNNEDIYSNRAQFYTNNGELYSNNDEIYSNNEDFYSTNYKATDLHSKFEDSYSCAIGNEMNETPRTAGHYVTTDSDTVWGYDHGPVARRREPDGNEEWPSVWKPPEYESDQSGYETDEELDNIDEEMLRLEEKLKKIEEELGMSTDDSSEEYNTESRLDIAKYFPLKTSYSTSHIDKAKQLEKRKVMLDDNHSKAGIADKIKTSSNDLLFLSGAGFRCGDRRCFSASLAEGYSKTETSNTEVSQDLFAKDINENHSMKSINVSNLSTNCPWEEEEQFFLEDSYINEFSLLDTFSDGHLWYDNEMTLIDFDNLYLVEERIKNDVIFFIFEDELLEEPFPEEVQMGECFIEEHSEANQFTNEPSCSPSTTLRYQVTSELPLENAPCFESKKNIYNTFLQNNYLDTLPCIPDDCTPIKSANTYDIQQPDSHLWASKNISKHCSIVQHNNSALLPTDDAAMPHSGRSSRFEREQKNRAQIDQVCDWQKMTTLNINQTYPVDRSSTVCHISENMFANSKNEGLEGTCNVYSSRGCNEIDDIGYHPYPLCDQSNVFKHDTIDDTTTPSGSFEENIIFSEVTEDCDLTKTDYPRRPERTKKRSKHAAPSVRDSSSTSMAGNNQQGHANHPRAEEARHSWHRRVSCTSFCCCLLPQNSRVNFSNTYFDPELCILNGEYLSSSIESQSDLSYNSNSINCYEQLTSSNSQIDSESLWNPKHLNCNVPYPQSDNCSEYSHQLYFRLNTYFVSVPNMSFGHIYMKRREFYSWPCLHREMRQIEGRIHSSISCIISVDNMLSKQLHYSASESDVSSITY